MTYWHNGEPVTVSDFTLSRNDMIELIQNSARGSWSIDELSFYLSGLTYCPDAPSYINGMERPKKVKDSFFRTTRIGKKDVISIENLEFTLNEVQEATQIPISAVMQWVETFWEKELKSSLPQIYRYYKKFKEKQLKQCQSEYQKEAAWLVERGVQIDCFIQACYWIYKRKWEHPDKISRGEQKAEVIRRELVEEYGIDQVYAQAIQKMTRPDKFRKNGGVVGKFKK